MAEAPLPKWEPQEMQVLGETMKVNSLIVVAGRGGIGKSHLAYQLLTDPEYGPDETMIFMAEDATSTYRVKGARIIRTPTFTELYDYIDKKVKPNIGKMRFPKAIFVDSISGMGDYERIGFKANPIMVETERGKVVRDKRAEFGQMGYSGMDLLIMLRDMMDCDIIAPVTSYEKPELFNDPKKGMPPPVELALEGKLLPKNLVRLTNLCLHMSSEETSFDPQRPPEQLVERPWRTISWEYGIVINRYFRTQDSGEFLGKGHSALDIKVPAYLPDVLRLIHGKEPLYIPKKREKK